MEDGDLRIDSGSTTSYCADYSLALDLELGKHQHAEE